MSKLENDIQTCLQHSAVPLRVQQIARQIGERNIALLSDALLVLQEQNLIERTGQGTWHIKQSAFKIRPDLKQSPTVSISSNHSNKSQPTSPGINPVVSPWAMFRRLCMFYAECARIEEHARISTFANRESNDFISIKTAVDWSLFESNHDVVLNSRDEWDAFLRTAPSTASNDIFYLGAPVDVYVHDNDGHLSQQLSPIFLIPVRLIIGNGTIRLRSTGRIEINHGWLQRRLKQADRCLFMRQMRLVEDEVASPDGTPHCFVPSMAEAYQGLWSCYRKWWREPADIRQPAKNPTFIQISESGIFNRTLLITSQPLKYSKRLVNELQDLICVEDAKLDQTALAPLFRRNYSPSPDPEQTQQSGTQFEVGEFCLLNPGQRNAVQKAFSQRLTVITGPPGTGKSTVVNHILANAAIHGQKALFASRNHQALEAVEPRLNAMLEGDEMLVIRPSRPSGESQQQFEWQQAMALLLSKPRREGALNSAETCRIELSEALTRRTQIEHAMQSLIDLREQLSKMELHLADILLVESPMVKSFIRDTDIPTCPPSFLANELKEKIKAHFAKEPTAWWQAFSHWWWRRRLRSLLQRTHHLTKDISESLSHIHINLSANFGSPVDRNTVLVCLERNLRLSHAIEIANQIREIESALRESESLTVLSNQLMDSMDNLVLLMRRTLQAIAESAGAGLTPKQRQHFAEICSGLANHGPPTSSWPRRTAFDKAFEDIVPELLTSFPVWCVSNLSVSKAAPLLPAVFDVVVIDEASQCDIGSVVPILFRAKRVVIVGDPMQLKHVASIPRNTELQIRKKCDLLDNSLYERFTHVENSCYGLASSCEHLRSTTYLTGHYRCDPLIADYCNNTFYNKTLQVLTNTDHLKRPHAAKNHGACMWTNCIGDIHQAPTGCYCKNQITIVIKELRQLVDEQFPGTIGVITPFRQHKNRLQDAIEESLGDIIPTNWHFIVDTVDGFQGDERDIILFSLVGGPSMPQGSKYFLYKDRNRFNVAVSRARAFLHVIGDREWAAESGVPFLAELVRTCEQSSPHETYQVREDLIGPVWEPLVANALRNRGLAIKQQYHTCGYYLDIALLREGFKLDIEVDGETYHRDDSGNRRYEDIYRDLILHAAGWKILRFWVYQLKENFEDCLEKIIQIWDHVDTE